MKIALVGNPNCGKTTIFNRLTNSRYKIANYPGVTVEQKLGIYKKNGSEVTVVDLPGIYSLNAHSEEEIIACDFILNEKPDFVVNIIDSSNLEKSLYLTTQLMELEVPLILVCNKIDLAKNKSIDIDYEKLSSFLEVKVIKAIGNKGEGIDEVIEACRGESKGIFLKFSEDIETLVKKISNSLKEKRWHSIKLLEEDPKITRQRSDVFDKYRDDINKLKKKYKKPIENVLSMARDKHLLELEKNVIKRKEDKVTFSDKLDKIVLNKYLSIPIFLGFMYLLFLFTFTLGAYPSNFLKFLFQKLSFFLNENWENSKLLKSLVIDGVINGVGSVLIFLPNILILFLSISLLEETGYMARAAFIMDKIMHRVGLHGKSFIPMLLGLGCTVPAIMSTRILENKKDRFVVMLALPLVSCSARLVVFTLLIPAFFSPANSAKILFVLYLIGFILAIFVMKVLKNTIFKENEMPFILEMPAYQFPCVKNLLLSSWDKAKIYVKKAGSIILFISVVLWFLSFFPNGKYYHEKFEKEISQVKNISEKTRLKDIRDRDILYNSFLGMIGRKVEPIFKPIGFDWKIDVAILAAMSAKEVFLTQLSIIFAVEKDSDLNTLQQKLKDNYTSVQGFSILLFLLISTPCLATIAMTKKETNSYFWAFFQFFMLSIFAYVISFLFYQIALWKF